LKHSRQTPQVGTNAYQIPLRNRPPNPQPQPQPQPLNPQHPTPGCRQPDQPPPPLPRLQQHLHARRGIVGGRQRTAEGVLPVRAQRQHGCARADVAGGLGGWVPVGFAPLLVGRMGAFEYNPHCFIISPHPKLQNPHNHPQPTYSPQSHTHLAATILTSTHTFTPNQHPRPPTAIRTHQPPARPPRTCGPSRR